MCLAARERGSHSRSQGDYIHNGDIIRLTGGYTTLFKSSLVLYAGRQGTLERIGEYECWRCRSSLIRLPMCMWF